MSNRVGEVMEHGFDLPNRRIFLHGNIEEDTVSAAIRSLYILADEPDTRAQLILSSYGGNLDESFALHDVMCALPSPVSVFAIGKCQSAAPLLIACGEKRFATEFTCFMLHDAQLEFERGSSDYPSNILASAEITEKTMDNYARLLGRYTKKPKRFWANIFKGKVDRYFTAQEAMDWGVIDSVWK